MDQAEQRRALSRSGERLRAIPEREAKLRVVLSPDWETLDEVRDFAALWLKRRFTNSVAARATSAVHELLEMSLRFGLVSGEIVLQIFDESAGGPPFEVQIENEMLPVRAEQLKKRIDALAGTSPADGYQHHVKLVAEGQGDDVALGFARVRHEAVVDLDLWTDDRRVTIVARGR